LNWKIEFDKKAKNDLLNFDKSAKNKILKFIDERLLKMVNPRNLGAPLKGNLSGFWKYRIGKYRLICKIEDNNFIILVISIGHRKNIYKI
jgi:mRNA interferase RelE/StbE